LHETENTAVFGQIDFDITDQLSLSVGGRWIDEEKTMCQVFTGRDATGEEPFYGNWPGPDYDANAGVDSRYAIKSWGACDSAIAATAQNNYTDLVTGEAKVFTGNESWDEFTPRVGLTYTTDNHMVYASYSEGFRSGGFNGRNNNAANSGLMNLRTSKVLN
jgi:iron complex outermembrane receptor protein